MKNLRWILFLPAAVVCGYLAYFIGGFINNLSTTLYFGKPPEGWLKIAVDAMTHMYLGAAFIYSAVRIAPSAPRGVALATLLLLLIFAGISLWSSFVIEKFYALPAIGGFLFGGVAVMVGTLAGEIVPYGISSSEEDRLN